MQQPQGGFFNNLEGEDMMRFEFPIKPWPIATNKWSPEQDDENAYKRAIKKMAKTMMGGRKPSEKMLEVIIYLHILPPKEVIRSRTKTARCELGTMRPGVKPDIQAYADSILDSLSKIVWRDDALVIRLVIEKFYSLKPRVELEVRELEDLLFV